MKFVDVVWKDGEFWETREAVRSTLLDAAQEFAERAISMVAPPDFEAVRESALHAIRKADEPES